MLHQSIWDSVRAILCDRIDEAAVKAQRLARADMSMPSALLAACLYLASKGWMDEPTAGETFFAWSPRAYRRYLDALTPEARAAELAAGHRVIFEGRAGRPPLIAQCSECVDGFVAEAD
ncbi:MAG TPA: hypothetical protein VNT42_03270 [Sphingomonas sp.]|nr:hypothetical protein [Sphingomonas sp.]